MDAPTGKEPKTSGDPTKKKALVMAGRFLTSFSNLTAFVPPDLNSKELPLILTASPIGFTQPDYLE